MQKEKKEMKSFFRNEVENEAGRLVTYRPVFVL